MITIDLGNPENLKKLDYLVGKITDVPLSIIDGDVFRMDKVEFDRGLFPVKYSPTTNVAQCFEATKNGFNIWWDHTNDPRDGGLVCFVAIGKSESMVHESELIARCLALVYSAYLNEVPDNELEKL